MGAARISVAGARLVRHRASSRARSGARALIALLLAASCSSDDECPQAVAVSETAARATVEAICEQHEAVCRFEQDTRLAWSTAATVFVSPVRCSEDVELCAFATWHELGHVDNGDNEHLADCYAADRATPAQTERAICYFTETKVVGGADEAHGAGDERAARIEGCR